MARSTQRSLVRIAFALVATVLILAGETIARSALAAPGVSGAWDTAWAGGKAVLELTQKGAAVSGTYTGTNEGTVNGTLAGNVLTGSWTGAANDGGGFVLRFSADGRSFNGTWGSGASKTDGGAWTGTRR